jgi:spore maturation protein CgeB
VRIALLGKTRGIAGWMEDAADAFLASGHDVMIASSRDPRLAPALNNLLLSPWVGAPLLRRIVVRIGNFHPDLILAIRADAVPANVLDTIAAIKGRVPLVGWVGDRIDADFAERAAYYDAIAYTDTGLLRCHRELGIATPASFVPHAVGVTRTIVSGGQREPCMAFVANPTAYRCGIVAGIREPVAIYGPGWADAITAPQHRFTHRRLARDEVAEVYAGHFAVLNMRNELNVIDGLNQRNFAPCVFATPVVTDDQPDLALCFEPDSEVLVYRSVAELNDIYARLLREPDYAAEIGRRGQQRVLAEHTYEHRLKALLALA